MINQYTCVGMHARRTSGFHLRRSVKETLASVSSVVQVLPLCTVAYDVQLENEPGARLPGGPVDAEGGYIDKTQ